MLARISGVLDHIEQNSALILLPGTLPGTEVGYEVMLPAYLAERLAPRAGSVVTLHTIEYHEQHAQGASFTPRLIGFESASDRRFFTIFTTVKGVGNKRALRALVAPIHEVARAITLRDAAALQKLPEIGKRIAETMIVELQAKVAAFASPAGTPAGAGAVVEGKPGWSSSGIMGEIAGGIVGGEAGRRAAAALVRLGESEASAEALLRRALEADPKLSTADELVAAALSAR